MQFLHRALVKSHRVGLLPGTFNPPTVAHLELARAGLRELDEVILLLPRELPHKSFSGASFAERLEMLLLAVSGEPALSVAASDRGLFIDIADEYRTEHDPEATLTFLCGRDAAERIAAWEYSNPDAFASMLKETRLLVAHRSGEYVPPSHLAQSIHTLRLPSHIEWISASEVRERIARGERWEHLVPEALHPHVRRIYSPTAEPLPPGMSPRY